MRTSLLLILGVTFSCGGGQRGGPADLTNHGTQGGGPSPVIATLARGACYGWCPVYTIAVHADGVVEYDGEQFVKQKGHHLGQLSADQRRALDQAFEQAGYFKLGDQYTAYEMTDMPSATTSFSEGGVTKTIQHYYGDSHAPVALTTLEDAIDRIVGVDQWIGTAAERDAHARDWR